PPGWRRASEPGPSRRPSTAQDGHAEPQAFEVTHPFHPLLGQRFPLVSRWRNWGGDRVLFEDGGRVRSLPTAWTSIADPDPFVAVSAGRSFFRIQDLF